MRERPVAFVSSAGCGQVAEWSIAADCKSAAQRATEVQILPCPPKRTQNKGRRTKNGNGERGNAVPGPSFFVPRVGQRASVGGSNSVVESQPSKLLVAGSIPV